MIVKYRIFSEVKMWYPDDKPPVNGELSPLTLTQNGWVCEVQCPHAEVEYYNEPDIIAMLWTGLKDCNGKDIYDGDIVEWRAERDTLLCAIEWCERSASFMMRWIGKEGWYIPIVAINDVNSTVLGNIHENPELLEV